MEHAEIARRLPTVSHGIKAAVADVESMVEELAGLPAGHERAGQIKQQVHSKLFMATRDLDEMQPDAPKPQPVVAKVEGDRSQQQTQERSGGIRLDDGSDRRFSNFSGREIDREGNERDLDFEHAGDGSGAPSDDHSIHKMEKKIDGEWLGIVVWLTDSVQHLERDGWTRVSAPREVEEGEKPVEHSADTVDHDADHDAGGEEFGAHGHAGDGPHFGDTANAIQAEKQRWQAALFDAANGMEQRDSETVNDVEGHAGGDPANAMPQADSTGNVKGRSSMTPNDAHHTPGQDKADA